MNGRVAHVDANSVLHATSAKAAFAREIDQPLVRGHQPQIAAAPGMGGIRQVIAKNGHDGKESVRDRTVELSRDWRLGDEHDRIRDREGLGAQSDAHGQHRSRKPNQTQPISKYHGVSLAAIVKCSIRRPA